MTNGNPPFVTIKPIGTQKPGQPISIGGEGAGDDGVTVTGHWQAGDSGMNPSQHAGAGEGGVWGANLAAPREPGVYTISAESSGQTTETTFAVKGAPVNP